MICDTFLMFVGFTTHSRVISTLYLRNFFPSRLYIVISSVVLKFQEFIARRQCYIHKPMSC